MGTAKRRAQTILTQTEAQESVSFVRVRAQTVDVLLVDCASQPRPAALNVSSATRRPPKKVTQWRKTSGSVSCVLCLLATCSLSLQSGLHGALPAADASSSAASGPSFLQRGCALCSRGLGTRRSEDCKSPSAVHSLPNSAHRSPLF